MVNFLLDGSDEPLAFFDGLLAPLDIVIHGACDLEVVWIVLIGLVDDRIVGKIQAAQGSVLGQDREELVEIVWQKWVPRQVQIFQIILLFKETGNLFDAKPCKSHPNEAQTAQTYVFFDNKVDQFLD